MTILDEILAKKQQEITELKRSYQRQSSQKKSLVSLYESFQQSDRMNIIAEFKRASPSKVRLTSMRTQEFIRKCTINLAQMLFLF